MAKQILWRPEPELAERLEAASFVLDRSMNSLINEAVTALLDAQPKAAEIRQAQAARKGKAR